jgi:hypothetical protein
MFKLFVHEHGIKSEVVPELGIYTVKELGDYEFEYLGEINTKFGDIIFIEDNLIEKKWYNYSQNHLYASKNKYFQDFFGFTSLNINGEKIKLNILIEKLKLSEIEEILMFLWKNENKIFENFFSKSTLKSKVDKNGSEFGLTSKFLIFANHFHDTFKKLIFHFQNSPHTLLRKKIHEVEYSENAVTPHSIEWLVNNLDNLILDNSFQHYPDSINANNRYGILNRIETESNQISYNTYENQIILGSLLDMLEKLAKLKKDIFFNISTKSFGNSEYADFRDLKKIPFIKLFEDSSSVEGKIKLLFKQYSELFKNTKPKKIKPHITPVFLNKTHYRNAFKLINDSKNLKFNLDGELQLLNIRRLSQLYEAYNLHIIINCFSKILKLEYFSVEIESNRNDKMISKISFNNSTVHINLFYELKYPNTSNETLLTRIDRRGGSYYNPDYIIELIKSDKSSYFIFDSKYSKYYTIKGNLLPDCTFKYILNTGIVGVENRKIDYLGILYPGDLNEYVIKSDIFNPQLQIIPSKPGNEEDLEKVLMNIIKKNIPINLYKELHEN